MRKLLQMPYCFFFSLFFEKFSFFGFEDFFSFFELSTLKKWEIDIYFNSAPFGWTNGVHIRVSHDKTHTRYVRKARVTVLRITTTVCVKIVCFGAFYYGNIAWDPEISHFFKGEKFKNISQKNMRNFSEKNENLKSSKKQYGHAWVFR